MRGKKNVLSAKKIVLAIIIALLFVSATPEVEVQASETEVNVPVEIQLGESELGDSELGERSEGETLISDNMTIQGAQPNAPGRLPQAGATMAQVTTLGILIILIGLVLTQTPREDKQELAKNVA